MSRAVARVTSPAKVNLGLAVTRRRDDGYHDIRSILAMIEMADDMVLTAVPRGEPTRVDGVAGVPPEENLITRAVAKFEEETREPQAWHIEVTKRIPSPAGLGGASSNAAATLLALNAMCRAPLPIDALHDLAASLGSDIPFFLGTPCAAVSGTGTDLSPLPPPSGWLVIAVPAIALAAKTASLYAALEPGDFTDGSAIDGQSHRLAQKLPLDRSLLANAFERPLAALVPETLALRDAMVSSGCDAPALSGAGPAHYALFDTEQHAVAAAHRIRTHYGHPLTLAVSRFRHAPVVPEIALGQQ
jgi:4-diphosphocytidyl-2-C-methyl-D-erythritol kinase